jgi:4-amino-4-deoxy-L-arabinose transferase-like glycosyltransferase
MAAMPSASSRTNTPACSSQSLTEHLAARYGGTTLLLLALVAYLPGFASLPPVDRDEARFAQASRQMVLASDIEDLIVPRVQQTPRLSKPPLIYWLQALAASVIDGRPSSPWGGRIWPYRLPSLLGAMVAVWCTWRLGRRLFGARVAWLGALLVLAAPMVLWDARQARADEVLLALTVIAQANLWSIWQPGDTSKPALPTVLAFWLAVGLGIMTKGPVTPAIAASTILALCAATGAWRWLDRLRPGLGIAIVTGITLPWVWMIGERVGWAHYATTVLDEVFGRSLSGKEGHWGPPGYHLLHAFFVYWPGTLVAPLALWTAAQRRWRQPAADCENGSRDAELFCLCWIVPAWLVFEIVATKLPHYTLPLYPPMALLTARYVLDVAGHWKRGSVQLIVRIAVVAGMIALLMTAGLLFVWTGTLGWVTTLGTGVATLTLMVASGAIAVRTVHPAAILLVGVAALLVGGTVIFPLLSRLDALWLSPRAVQLAQRVDPRGERPLAAVGFHEDSLIFLTAGRVQRIQPSDMATWLDTHPEGLVLMSAEATPPTGALHRLGEVRGVNYSKGERLTLVLVERNADPSAP